MEQGILFIISAPSGGGKTTLVDALIAKTAQLVVSVSHTTRSSRPGEMEGKNYFFVSEAQFQEGVATGNFLEHAKVFNNWYGTSKEWVLSQLKMGNDVILEIDWQGARRVREQMPACGIFILPPSRQILLSRLESRQKDSSAVIQDRMKQASEEISHYTEYDYVIVNDDFNEALQDLIIIVKAERLRMKRQQQRYQALLKELV